MPSQPENQQRRSPAPARTQNHHSQEMTLPPPPPPQTTEALHCPRCDSSNTKFCYYNNYNLSQPRHFCKSCRRYWTHGGTLRDVPVGGGSRKSAKRSRSSSAAAAAATSSSSSSSSTLVKTEPGSGPGLDPNPNASECVTSNNGLGFTSLLNSQSPGLLALGGYGYGYGLEEISGFGFGAKAVWPFHEVGDFGGGASAPVGGGGGVGNTWQIASGSEGGLVDGSSVDCFVWPDLSISMPGGNGFK